MDTLLYYLVLFGALLGSVYYLSRGVKVFLATKNKQEGVLIPKTHALMRIAIGVFGIIL